MAAISALTAYLITVATFGLLMGWKVATAYYTELGAEPVCYRDEFGRRKDCD